MLSTWSVLWMCWHSLLLKSKWNKHASVPARHLVWTSFVGRVESEWTPCGVATRRVELGKARWSYLLTDDSCIVLPDSSVWKVLWIQSQMPPLLWYSCLDTKSTWTSIWSQHAALHVRQLLSQNSLFLCLSSPPSSCVSFYLPIDILLFSLSHFSCDIICRNYTASTKLQRYIALRFDTVIL